MGIPVYMPITVDVALEFANESHAEYVNFVSQIANLKPPEKDKRITTCPGL